MNNYWNQPYHYVMFAVEDLWERQRRKYHAAELPIANLASIITNQNRDSKRHRKPFSHKDFLFFAPSKTKDLPEGRFGAAAMELHNRGMLPPWTLFCFPQLISNATEGYIPAMCALISKDAVLLHPLKRDGGYTGMLIAREAASGKVHDFTDDNGNIVKLKVPQIQTKIIAVEESILFP